MPACRLSSRTLCQPHTHLRKQSSLRRNACSRQRICLLFYPDCVKLNCGQNVLDLRLEFILPYCGPRTAICVYLVTGLSGRMMIGATYCSRWGLRMRTGKKFCKVVVSMPPAGNGITMFSTGRGITPGQGLKDFQVGNSRKRRFPLSNPCVGRNAMTKENWELRSLMSRRFRERVAEHVTCANLRSSTCPRAGGDPSFNASNWTPAFRWRSPNGDAGAGA
jgi:hypothetical protein